MPWRKKRDPLFRGDHADGPAVPDPASTTSIVDHILYLGGAGRATPFQSTTEAEEIAVVFAGRSGRVYRTSAPRAAEHSVAHIGQVELTRLLTGKGQGRAKSSSAYLVSLARRYVEQWAEHLLDFTDVPGASVAQVVKDVYEP